MNNVVLTAPAVEPVTLTEAKAQLNIDALFTDDDTFIGNLITSSRLWLEQRTGQSFIKQQRVQYMDKFPLCGKFPLTNGPVLLTGDGVSAPVVKYYDSTDTEQTWADTNYWFDNKSFEPRIITKLSWPTVGDRPSAVSVTYFAGFGLTAADVPTTIKDAMRLLISHLYNNRVPEFETVKGVMAKLEHGIERVISFDTRLMFVNGTDRY